MFKIILLFIPVCQTFPGILTILWFCFLFGIIKWCYPKMVTPGMGRPPATLNDASSLKWSKTIGIGGWGIGGLGDGKFGGLKVWGIGALGDCVPQTWCYLNVVGLAWVTNHRRCLASSVKIFGVLPENRTTAGGLLGFKSKVVAGWKWITQDLFLTLSLVYL